MNEHLILELHVPAIRFQAECRFPCAMQVSDGIALAVRLVAAETGLAISDADSLRLFFVKEGRVLQPVLTFGETGLQHGDGLMLL